MVGGRGEAKAQRRHPPQHRNRIAKHNSTETPVALKAPTFPLLSGCKPRDAGIKLSPRISTPTCCLQFCFIVPLRLAAYKIMFVLPLPLSILPLAAKTNTQQYSNTPISELEKKRKIMKTSQHTCGPGTQMLNFWEKRKQLYSVFLPSVIFLPHPTPRNPEGFFTLGSLPKGQGH